MVYPTVEKELCAVVFAFNKLKKFLMGRPFELFTDNSAVLWLLRKSECSSRLQRWIACLQEFDFSVKHISGNLNSVADALSRNGCGNQDMEEGEKVWELAQELYGEVKLVVEKEAEYEDKIQMVYDYLASGQIDEASQMVKNKSRQFKVDDQGRLWRHVGVGGSRGGRWILVVKLQERLAILKEVHDGHGHFGCQSTWARLYMNYWWNNAYQDIKEYISTCYECQVSGSLPKREAPNKIDVAHIFERWGVDFLGAYPATEKDNKYIIVAVEYYTKWPVARAVKVADSETVVKFLYEEIFTKFGPIMTFLTDQGSHFDNLYVEKFAEHVQAKHKFAAGYHPKTNGLTERFNGTLLAN